MTQSKIPFRRPSADEQTVLRELGVRLLARPEDIEKCDCLLVEHHSLHSAQLVGEHLGYAVVWRGQWLAVAAWSAPALPLKARDAGPRRSGESACRWGATTRASTWCRRAITPIWSAGL